MAMISVYQAVLACLAPRDAVVISHVAKGLCTTTAIGRETGYGAHEAAKLCRKLLRAGFLKRDSTNGLYFLSDTLQTYFTKHQKEQHNGPEVSR